MRYSALFYFVAVLSISFFSVFGTVETLIGFTPTATSVLTTIGTLKGTIVAPGASGGVVCGGDLDGDGDSDGLDLGRYAGSGNFSELAEFAAAFGSLCASPGMALNDTGVTTCSNATAGGLSCNDTADGTDQFPGQDAESGRDATDNDDSDGHAGFVFTKLDGSGNPLGDQALDYDTAPWSCVRDEVTGLVWEVKSADGGLNDGNWIYSWYNSSGISDGGDAGVESGGRCADGSSCDTEKYVLAVNQAALCGFTDWRVPKRRELLSLMNFGASEEPYIDRAFFVNTARQPYWTSSIAGTGSRVAYVNFSDYGSGFAHRRHAFALRLVRGGHGP